MLGVAKAPLDAKQLACEKQDVEQQVRSDSISRRNLTGVASVWLRRGETTDPRQVEFDRAVRVDPRAAARMLANLATSPTYIRLSGDLVAIGKARLAKLERSPHSRRDAPRRDWLSHQRLPLRRSTTA